MKEKRYNQDENLGKIRRKSMANNYSEYRVTKGA